MASWLSWLERRPVTAEVAGSSPAGVVSNKCYFWDHSSAGRAPALQAGGHRFEPCWSHFCESNRSQKLIVERKNVTVASPLDAQNTACSREKRFAGVAELADAQDLKSCRSNTVPVRFRSPALSESSIQ